MSLVWTIRVCPVCGHQSPAHGEPCISSDPPSLRTLHEPIQVVQRSEHARLESLARWLVSMDDPEDVFGLAERREVTLTRIIERAREALEG